jgi:hypothetical protein
MPELLLVMVTVNVTAVSGPPALTHNSSVVMLLVPRPEIDFSPPLLLEIFTVEANPSGLPRPEAQTMSLPIAPLLCALTTVGTANAGGLADLTTLVAGVGLALVKPVSSFLMVVVNVTLVSGVPALTHSSPVVMLLVPLPETDRLVLLTLLVIVTVEANPPGLPWPVAHTV